MHAASGAVPHAILVNLMCCWIAETYTLEAPCISNNFKAGQLWLEREDQINNIELTVVGVCLRFSSYVLTFQDISSRSSYVVTFQTMKSLLKL